ncbi:transketolase [Streptomyces pluripotens]|uniref:Transketolase n=1 Tax=Streptomyces pluripotens TaxID=1355015 RepID=A0A221P5T8_9ACTN|nr:MULTISPECIES: transketolase [Streptomyces]ARP73301.1 transketolase [Streptomyces pluripotens]ASN27550.1 transketolase [Streptomyces pluripotens]KIE23278.1 transketolase [Streptomyces sp. MUSC 125]MCH0560826.1 transketolase [Streptomyces sp. MUM 16J]
MTITSDNSRTYGYEDLPRLMGLMTGDEKHGPAATSTLDVLWVLYDRVLRVTPERRQDPSRDRFLLSKGHGPMAYYAVLAAKGFVPVEWLPGFGSYDSPLGHHPDRVRVPGAEIGSGSLGHGLPIAVGSALGLRAQGLHDPAIWVLIGDAELDEGSNHEAIAFAGPAGLERLHTVVVDNSSASHALPGGIAARFEAAGWSAVTVDGRDQEALYAACTAPHPGRPHVVVARVEPKST